MTDAEIDWALLPAMFATTWFLGCMQLWARRFA